MYDFKIMENTFPMSNKKLDNASYYRVPKRDRYTVTLKHPLDYIKSQIF